MSKQVMNMQLSQRKIVLAKGNDFTHTADNVFELGFRPAMIKGIMLDSSDDPLYRFYWYAVDEDEEFSIRDTENGTGFVNVTNNFLEVTENGFILDGVEAAKEHGDPRGVIIEAEGGYRIDAHCPITVEASSPEAHPDAVTGNTAMDTTDYLPEL